MGTKIDFKKLNSELLSQAHYLLSQWLPGGRIQGSEYTCGDLSGGEGQSLKVNINTGLWCDFATDIKGGDLISLYAAIHGMSQIDAARELSGKAEVPPTPSLGSVGSSQQTKKPVELVMPTSPLTRFKHSKLGIPSKTWTYYNETGHLCFYISRYETEKGKEFRPWSFNSEGKWCNKAWPENRPLLNVDKLRPDKPVLIVEGEKACDAARVFLGGTYDVVTWVGGAQAISKTNWTPIHGRKILIWPDQDQAGIGAGNRIADLLFDHCPEVKVIDVSGLEQDGSDAADYDFNYKTWAEWAKPLVKVYERPVVETAIEPDIDNNPALMPEPPKDWLNQGAPLTEIAGMLKDQLNSVAQFSSDELENIRDVGLAVNKQEAPHNNIDNVTRVLERSDIFKGTFWYDEFHLKVFFKNEHGVVRIWDEDSDSIEMVILLQRYFGLIKISKEQVNDAVLYVAKKIIKNEPKDWFNELKWDGVPRISQLFKTYFGSDQNQVYTNQVSKNFLISIVARVYDPGCQVDTMPIIWGEQGKKKSTGLRALGGKWFTSTKVDPGNKDFYLTIRGRILVELSELASFRVDKQEEIKEAISTPIDTFRAPYERGIKDHKRTVVFAGTTNKREYLSDDTGSRRFWPIDSIGVDIEAIERDREQLFAEAVSLYKSGATWWEVDEDLLNAEHHKRTVIHEWVYVISDYLSGKSFVSMDEVIRFGVGISYDKTQRSVSNTVAKCLKYLGWENHGVEKFNGEVKRIYRPRSTEFLVPDKPRITPQTIAQKRLFNHAPGADNS